MKRVEPSLVFPTEYQVQVLAESVCADVDRYEFHRPGEASRGDVLLDVVTDEGGWWLGSVRRPSSYVRGALTGVCATPSPSNVCVCVVIGGDAFLIDVNDPSSYIWLNTGGPVTATLSVVAEKLLLLATPWLIQAVDRDGVRWRTDRLAIDGLRMDEVAGGLLAGVADPDDDEPRDFVVDLRSGRHEGGLPAAWS